MLAVPFVSGWRKITIGEKEVYGGTFYGWTGNTGSISDPYVEGKLLDEVGSTNFRSGGTDDQTKVTFTDLGYVENARTLYLKVKGRGTISLTGEPMEGIWYWNHSWQYFTSNDVGKTMDLYLGITPPP